MKKSIVFLIFTILVITNSMAEYKRVTKNGGANGYLRTTEVRTGGDTYINCTDPGYTECPKSFHIDDQNDPNLNNVNLLIEYAILQIESNNLVGQYNMYGLTVNWTSDSPNMYNSEITVK